jgi:NADH:ubiquinone oxidoreductase subunit 2 (subunit N)
MLPFMVFHQLLLVAVFVLLLYTKKGHRDDEQVIQYRVLASIASCIIGFGIVWSHDPTMSLQSVLESMGFNLTISYRHLMAVMVLFGGSIYSDYKEGTLWGVYQPKWIAIRSYIAVKTSH